MENRSHNIDTIGKDLREYAELRLELFKIDMVEKTSLALSSTIKYIAIGFLIALFVGFAMLGGAFWLSQQLGSYAKGFSLASLIFLALAFLIAITSRIWMPALRNSFINSFFDGLED
ncbi:MAG: phage holin family protein [Bacteroidota bacterium]